MVRNDRIRLQQIVLLQSFSLRSDMELELEPLLLDEFDPDLAAYIGEIAKIKRELINSKAIRYLLAHEADILRMEHGRQIMIDAAGAAVRKKNISIPSLILLVAMRTDFRDIASSACIRSYAAIPACRGTACGTGCRPFIMNTTARTLIFKMGLEGYTVMTMKNTLTLRNLYLFMYSPSALIGYKGIHIYQKIESMAQAELLYAQKKLVQAEEWYQKREIITPFYIKKSCLPQDCKSLNPLLP